ncbi:MAG TPA: sulfurtransferase TusA family protein [Xanthobacteraceae bacterium]|nr:sulfurtransferase TusA family protein [Xanthobacteraceae bacterium]
MLSRTMTTICETVLDLRGVRCPHVVLRAKKALRAVPVGGTLVLECTDPLTVIDVPHFVTQTGHALSAHERQAEIYVFRILKQH